MLILVSPVSLSGGCPPVPIARDCSSRALRNAHNAEVDDQLTRLHLIVRLKLLGRWPLHCIDSGVRRPHSCRALCSSRPTRRQQQANSLFARAAALGNHLAVAHHMARRRASRRRVTPWRSAAPPHGTATSPGDAASKAFRCSTPAVDELNDPKLLVLNAKQCDAMR